MIKQLPNHPCHTCNMNTYCKKTSCSKTRAYDKTLKGQSYPCGKTQMDVNCPDCIDHFSECAPKSVAQARKVLCDVGDHVCDFQFTELGHGLFCKSQAHKDDCPFKKDDGREHDAQKDLPKHIEDQRELEIGSDHRGEPLD